MDLPGWSKRLARGHAPWPMTKRQLALLERLESWFDANPHATSMDAARGMRMPPEAAEAVVNLGVTAGRLVRIGSEVYTAIAFEALVAMLRDKFGQGQFQPRDAREALAEGRSWIDQFADVLSRKGLLERFPGGWQLKEPE